MNKRNYMLLLYLVPHCCTLAWVSCLDFPKQFSVILLRIPSKSFCCKDYAASWQMYFFLFHLHFIAAHTASLFF